MRMNGCRVRMEDKDEYSISHPKRSSFRQKSILTTRREVSCDLPVHGGNAKGCVNKVLANWLCIDIRTKEENRINKYSENKEMAVRAD